jgi:hypothetical protein
MTSNINHSYPIQCLLSFGSHVLNYSTCKCANWVLEAFLKPSLVPKCVIYYLKNKCCYTYSNSIVVALSHTYVIYFTWTNLKLIYALIKHKNFINYICLVQFSLKSYWSSPAKLSDPYLTDHDPLPYPSCHNISINRIVKQTLFNCLICLIVFVWCVYGMLFLCYSWCKELRA